MAITTSGVRCPPLMCEMFWCLRELAATHFPKNKEVRYSVISGFIFLRFFAPAILGPRLFDITTEQIVSNLHVDEEKRYVVVLYLVYFNMPVFC